MDRKLLIIISVLILGFAGLVVFQRTTKPRQKRRGQTMSTASLTAKLRLQSSWTFSVRRVPHITQR
jgi:hypothetical protein